MHLQAKLIDLHHFLHFLTYAFIVICYSFWVLAGIPWILDLKQFTLYQSTIIFNISVVGVIFSMILLMLYVIRSQFDFRTSFMAGVTLAFVLIAFGLFLSYFSTGMLYYTIEEQNGTRVLVVKQPMLFLEALGNLSFASTYFLASYRITKTHSNLLSKKEKRKLQSSVVALFIALVMAVFGSIFLQTPLVSLAKLLEGLSRLFALATIILFSHILWFDPISIATLKWNPIRLRERGIVGWVVTSLSDAGVNIVKSSPEWMKVYDITYEDLIRFGGASLTVIGMGDIFADALFLIPFPKRGPRLFALNISFPLIDDSLKDERLNTVTKAIFSFTMPLEALQLVKKINLWEGKARRLLKKIETMEELQDTSRMESIATYLLKSLF